MIHKEVHLVECWCITTKMLNTHWPALNFRTQTKMCPRPARPRTFLCCSPRQRLIQRMMKRLRERLEAQQKSLSWASRCRSYLMQGWRGGGFRVFLSDLCSTFDYSSNELNSYEIKERRNDLWFPASPLLWTSGRRDYGSMTGCNASWEMKFLATACWEDNHFSGLS